MNNKNLTVALAFVLGAVAALGVLRLTLPPPAAAQVTNEELIERMNSLQKRITVLENQLANGSRPAVTPASNGGIHPGSSLSPSGGPQGVGVNPVITLKSDIESLQGQLAKLDKAFLGHRHTYTVAPVAHWSVDTPIHCTGYLKPCVGVADQWITVLQPANGPPSTTPFTGQTSAPVAPNGN